MNKIAIVAGVNNDLDAVRGVGVHNSELFKAINLLNDKRFKFVSDPKLADVTHYTKFHPFFISLPFLKPSKKVILTIHDLIPLIYPRHYPSGVKGKLKFLINKYLIWKNVDAIITISETSKKDICRFLGVDPKIVHVIYLAPKDIFRKIPSPKYEGIPKRFALYTGDINYNKNIPNLIKACEIAKIPLVIAGKQAKEIESMDLTHPETSHLMGVSFKNVIRLGFVSDEELNNLYNLAAVYIQASLYEGFGLPILEAMSYGCPVITSTVSSLPEAGGDAALYVDPMNSEDIASKITRVLDDEKLRKELIEKGYKQIKKFSWEKTAKETLSVLEQVANNK
jgi:glycosyltransferase involved in cell wall biosynthesis